MIDPQKFADRWAKGIEDNAAKYVESIQALTENPMEKAAASGEAYLAGVRRAEESGKRARNLRKRTLAEFKQAVSGKGRERIVSGSKASKSKMVAAAQTLLPYVEQLKAQVRAMPNVTDSDKEQRALAWIRGMRAYQGG